MARSIGRYEIREELGRGGMATVYLAFDPRLDRQVALKLMDQRLSTDPAFVARFEREAQTVAGLEHGAIVPLYDFGESGGWLYLVMRYMEGGTLKELIARGPLATGQAYEVVRRIGRALDKAHGQDIIHRDLKPANVLLDEEQEPYLSDFGIVKVAAGDTEYLTETGQTIGTFAYMSPEQVMGQELNSRSDIYALGLVLYEMLAGTHPFSDAATSGAMAVAQTHEPVPDITGVNPALPAACQAVIEKALAKDPAERYASGREMAAALSTALSSELPAEITLTQGPEAAGAPPVTGKPGPVTPVTDQPVAQPQARQPEAQPAPGRPEPVAATYSEVKRKPGVKASRTEVQQEKVEKTPAAASPFPRWILVLQGLVTIVAAIAVWTGYFLFIFYWLIIGLLTAASLFSRPADWRWRAAIVILSIIDFVLLFLSLVFSY